MIVQVAVYWRLPEATGDGPKGKWYEAAVKSVNSRKGTIQIAYLEDGSRDDVNFEDENVVCQWMDPVGNIEAEEDLRNESEDPQRAAPKKQKGPKCEHGK